MNTRTKKESPSGLSFLVSGRQTRTHVNAAVRWTVATRRLDAGCSIMYSSPVTGTKIALIRYASEQFFIARQDLSGVFKGSKEEWPLRKKPCCYNPGECI